MMKFLLIQLLALALFLNIVSCSTSHSIRNSSSDRSSSPRVIVLNGDSISEKEAGGFISWTCKDYISGGPVLVEVGFFGDPILKGSGFLLYDNGNSGILSEYARMGLEHRWDWTKNGSYSFVIKTDGTGLYYDFTDVPYGESTKPKEIYRCYQRK